MDSNQRYGLPYCLARSQILPYNRSSGCPYGRMEVVGLITSDSGAGKRNAPIHGYGDAHYVVAGARQDRSRPRPCPASADVRRLALRNFLYLLTLSPPGPGRAPS